MDNELFGTAFVTSERYEEILKNGAKKAEDYTYAYRLGNGVTDKELKTAIKEFDFDYEQVEEDMHVQYNSTLHSTPSNTYSTLNPLSALTLTFSAFRSSSSSRY